MSEQVDIWKNSFGDSYYERNQFDDEHIKQLSHVFAYIYNKFAPNTHPQKILEIGCGTARQLRAIERISSAELYGIEPNRKAREEAQSYPEINEDNIIDGTCEALPFKDNEMDLAFTACVLIHMNEENLISSIKEIERVSSRYVLAIEYFSQSLEVVPYRNHDNFLHKRDFGSYYMDHCPSLHLMDYGFFWKRVFPCQDDTTWWLFEKR